MARRGRPPYPDVLTPREWEVLALLREGRSNEEIAERLGISLAGAKYHVSEILGKLGVESREEAARWQPRERAWWAVAAPLAWLWRKAGSGPLAAATAAGMAALVAAGIGLLVWGLLRTNGSEPQASGQPNVLFCTVDLPQSWRAALDRGKINLPATDYFYAAAVSADASQVFGSLHSDDWSGVVAVDRQGVITRIRQFDNPDTDSIWNAVFDGRWLAWSERHSEQYLGGADLHVWDRSTNEVIELASSGNGVISPVISQGRLAWAEPRVDLVHPFDLHLYSLIQKQDRIITSDRQPVPVLFTGSRLLLFERNVPLGGQVPPAASGQFKMVDAITGESSTLSEPFASVVSTDVSASNDVVAWSNGGDGWSIFAWRPGDPEPLRIYAASGGDIAAWVSTAGDIVEWEVQSRETTMWSSMAADLRSRSIALVPEGTTLSPANGNALVFQKSLETPAKKGGLVHVEVDVVNTADLPPLPGCSS